MLLKADSSAKKTCAIPNSGSIFLSVGLLSLFGLTINYYHVSFLYSSFGICQPKTNIVFLKTHKCAGSSIQNILMRYGDFHNLTFVLPPTQNYLGYPAPFNKSLILRPWLPKYNILAHHTRLNYSAIRQFMPQDTVFVTIVRDPVSLFESGYDYYGLEKIFHKTLSDFLRSAAIGSPDTLKRSYDKFGLNQMVFDLGADSDIFYNDGLVNDYVDKLESWFDLVMVAERMDESLVLLKELLCWDMDDVVTFKLNARSDTFKKNVTVAEAEAIRKLNRADQILYDRFVSKFERSVDDFGRDRMAEEASELNQRTRAWKEFCVFKEVGRTTINSKTKYYFNPKVLVLEPRHGNLNRTCNSLISEELPFTDYLRRKQIALLPTRKPRKHLATKYRKLRRDLHRKS